MGMFDWVNYECTCPVCHGKVDSFQSKDGECLMATLEPANVMNFYASCDKCGCWINYNAKEITDFTMTVRGKGDKILSEHTKDVFIK